MQILYEDADILFLNKPPGWVVNEASTYQGLTLQAWFSQYLLTAKIANNWQTLVPEDFNSHYGSPEEIWQQRAGMLHRLDKDTSGVMVWAKNPGALVNLLAQFKKREVKKVYACLVHGLFSVPKERVFLPLGRKSGQRELFTVRPDGREAVTEYEVEKSWAEFDFEKLKSEKPEELKKIGAKKRQVENLYQGFSLVHCLPKTGRTHQIRVHMQHLKHPLVGDEVYNTSSKKRLDKLWCDRQFLHALSLKITHPRSGEELEIKAPLANDLAAALDFLKN